MKLLATDGPGAKVRAWLMTGVSYVTPFVAAGGLLIALGFAPAIGRSQASP